MFNRGSAPYRASRKHTQDRNGVVANDGEERKNGDDVMEEIDEEMRVTKVNLDRRNVSLSRFSH